MNTGLEVHPNTCKTLCLTSFSSARTLSLWCHLLLRLHLISRSRLVGPRSPEEGALVVCLGLQPLPDALNMESVSAYAPHHGAVVAWVLAIWRASIKGSSTNAAHIVACIPCPGRHGVPLLDVDLEGHDPATVQHLLRY